MRQTRVSLRVLFILLACTIPIEASAQSAIAGAVSDATGGLLPGVTVEARSPALIEQLRTAVTDTQGQYRLVDLRPGVYTVTFTLAGFQTVRHEGIELQSDFTAPLNVEMRVGGIEESVTVTGASPIVDVQSTQRREVVPRELYDTIPSGRNFSTIGVTLPSITSNTRDVGGHSQGGNGVIQAYGGTSAQSVMVDGLRIDGPSADGVITVYINAGTAEEYVYQVTGGTAEQSLGVVAVNMIPRSGGNTFSGNLLMVRSSPALSSSNITPAQAAAGLSAIEVKDLHDYNGGIGGPIKRDRLWFFSSYRDWDQNFLSAYMHDGRLGPTGTPVIDANMHWALSTRLTLQATSRDRFSVMYERSGKTNQYQGLRGGTRLPEASQYYSHPIAYYALAKWTSVVRNTLFLEGGYSMPYKGFFMKEQPGIAPEIPSRRDVTRNLFYSNVERSYYRRFFRGFYSGSASYVTGSHALKGGVQADTGYDQISNDSANGALTQLYRSGVPFSVNVYDFPSNTQASIRNVGFYLQDSWTLKRLTLNPGVRWDRLVGSTPALSMPAGRFVPARTFAPLDNIPNWHDLALRLGVAYDLFGNGRTAIKASTGKYLVNFGSVLVHQYSPSNNGSDITPDARDWSDLNGDDIAQDNEIGPSRNPAWGVVRFRQPADDYRRPHDILSHVSLDRELLPGLGVSVGYNRRVTKNLSWSDNLTYTPADYELLTVADPRGTGTLPVYQVIPARVGPANTLDKSSQTDRRTYEGVDATFHARLSGLYLTGGMSTGRTHIRACDVEDSNALRFCDQQYPFQTVFKLSGSYPLPWYGFRVSGVLQSTPSIENVLTYVVTRAQLPQLVSASSVTVRLNEPGSEYLPRLNQVDLSVSRMFKLGTMRVMPQVDFFNAFNANTVLAQTTAYPTQGRPTNVLQGRIIRVGGQVDF